MKRVYCDKETNMVSQIFDLEVEPELEASLLEHTFCYCYMVDTDEDIDYSYRYNRDTEMFEKSNDYVEPVVRVIPPKVDLLEEDLAVTQDALDFLLMSRSNYVATTQTITKGGVTTMAAYFAKRIMKGALTYKEVIAKYPEYKEDIDFILKAEGKGDLITQ